MANVHTSVAALLIASALLSQAALGAGSTPAAAPDPTTEPAEIDNSRQTFFDPLLGGNFYEWPGNLVLGKVVESKKDPFPGGAIVYALDIIADYRSDLKEHQHVSIEGHGAHDGSNFAPLPELALNQVVLLYVAATKRPGVFEYAGELMAPFGKVTPKAIAPAEVDEVKQALAEMHRLIPGDGHGPVPHDEAKRLLQSKVYSLWALGACLLAFEGNVDEVQALAREAGTAKATLAELDWVRYLLTEVVPAPAKAKADAELNPMILNYISTHNPELQPLVP